ncbi:MAG: anti-phage ZorAB system protein ZorA, partial [Gammaproteobacteria bacterium]
MKHVGLAFTVSGVAITAAMAITFLEKWLLSGLYRKTEEVSQAIDAKFVAGAGEEYLSRLVRASEDSASQSKILKDALVKELGDLLRDLTNAQIKSFQTQQSQLAEKLSEVSRQQVEAARQDSEALGASIASSIEKSLSGPLDAIANTVKAASGDQSATAARMMQDVMVSFSQRLNDIFGGQISGLSDLNKQTVQSIQAAVGSLQALVGSLEESSRRSTDSMAERMAQAVEKMEARQEAINAQSQAFVEQIRQLVASSQSETNLKLQVTLENIGNQVGAMLGALTESQKQTFESHREREEQMAARTSGAVGAMSESVEGAIKEIGAASAQMAKNVELLSRSTTS